MRDNWNEAAIWFITATAAPNTSRFVTVNAWRRLALSPRWAAKVAARQRAGQDHQRSLQAELIHRRAPLKTRVAVELATLESVSWFNEARLLAPIG